jgi:hypothetical protein
MPQKSAQLVMITLPPMSLKRQSFLENNKALASEISHFWRSVQHYRFGVLVR